jgi:hypothetical protein
LEVIYGRIWWHTTRERDCERLLLNVAKFQHMLENIERRLEREEAICEEDFVELWD